MTTLDPRTPVLVGVGQASERIDDPGYRGLSAVEPAADAVREVTINRPEARNSLHPPAHEELDAVFDAGRALDALMVSEDATEAITAFAQKRKPVWRNR